MAVVVAILVSLVVVWTFASKDFALNITFIWVSFGIIELINLALTRKTISQKFHAWAYNQPSWEIWLVLGSILLVMAFLMYHLGNVR